MKLYEGIAFGALIIGMGLAFLLNHAGKPIWLSLFAGIGIGLAVYFGLISLKRRRISE